MKKSLCAVTILVALAITFGCVVVGLAQTRPIVGGYKVVATDDAEVVAAAEFAVGEQGKKQESTVTLVSIEKAEQQVVAGMNYKLCLKVTVGDDADEPQDVKVVVFRSLKKEYSLKSWEEESCSESESDGNNAR
jgi:hypothetical protein